MFPQVPADDHHEEHHGRMDQARPHISEDPALRDFWGSLTREERLLYLVHEDEQPPPEMYERAAQVYLEHFPEAAQEGSAGGNSAHSLGDG